MLVHPQFRGLALRSIFFWNSMGCLTLSQWPFEPVHVLFFLQCPYIFFLFWLSGRLFFQIHSPIGEQSQYFVKLIIETTPVRDGMFSLCFF